jgi:GntR family transcriptional regulator
LQDNGVPVYVQIRDPMLQAMGAQILQPGEQMPTMREVAVALKVDLNTVRHAYAALEETREAEGLTGLMLSYICNAIRAR